MCIRDRVSDICFSYTEVLLNLAECESRLGNSAQAENYLNQVMTADVYKRQGTLFIAITFIFRCLLS